MKLQASTPGNPDENGPRGGGDGTRAIGSLA
jgi:hypothetical protein